MLTCSYLYEHVWPRKTAYCDVNGRDLQLSTGISVGVRNACDWSHICFFVLPDKDLDVRETKSLCNYLVPMLQNKQAEGGGEEEEEEEEERGIEPDQIGRKGGSLASGVAGGI
jgi:hypothetical protein